MRVIIRPILIVLSIIGVLYISLYAKAYFDFEDAKVFCSTIEKGMSQADNESVVSMDNKIEGANTKIMTASERASVLQTRRYTDRFGYNPPPSARF